jgi:hypothetical protein
MLGRPSLEQFKGRCCVPDAVRTLSSKKESAEYVAPSAGVTGRSPRARSTCAGTVASILIRRSNSYLPIRPLPWSRSMTRHAACSCGQLHLKIEGEPSRNAMCHCLACQRRTGAVISNQARYGADQVTITGKSTAWQRTADSGNTLTFHFCPTCGSTVFWENAGFPGLVSVAIGNFADPSFPAPAMAVWEVSRHPWVNLPPDIPPKRAAKQG